MSTPGFPDWASPVAAIESLSQVYTSVPSLPFGTPSPTLDVSAFSSVLVVVTMPVDATGTEHTLSTTWIDAGLGFDSQVCSFHSRSSYPGNPFYMTWQLPVRAQQMIVEMDSTGGGGTVVTVYGSTRTLASPSLSFSTNSFYPLVYDSGTVALAGNANSPLMYVPPVSSRCRFRLGGSLTSAVMFGNGVTLTPTGVAGAPMGTWYKTSASAMQDEYYVPGIAQEFQVDNSIATAGNFRLCVWDVS